MFTKVTTTITTEIDLDTFEPTHSVNIDAEEGLPRQIILAAVEGGARALLKYLTADDTEIIEEIDEEIDEEGDQ